LFQDYKKQPNSHKLKEGKAQTSDVDSIIKGFSNLKQSLEKCQQNFDIPDVFLEIDATVLAKFAESKENDTTVKATDFELNDTKFTENLLQQVMVWEN
jgi:hypothetical protein